MFVYSPICENLTISSHTSILTKNYKVWTKRQTSDALYDFQKSTFCYMYFHVVFHVLEGIYQFKGIFELVTISINKAQTLGHFFWMASLR